MAEERRLSKEQTEELLKTLEERFARNKNRHEGLAWPEVLAKLAANPDKMRALHEMEQTGGEPDVTGYDPDTGEYIFCDCAPESPAGRRSLCYDREAWEARKEAKPRSNAMEMAAGMGIALLTEEQYRALQKLGEFDRKTSSWIMTPPNIRKLGGALFCDRRYDHVFVYHNGVESYYAGRGFRGTLRV